MRRAWVDRAHAQLLFLEGRAARVHGDHDTARDRLTRAVELDPTHARAAGNLAVVLEALGDTDAALAAARRALDLQPGLADPARVLRRAG
jgi:Flp pilus assembly protein TadD